ncbi:Nucleolar complex protein 4 [Allomyces arbusculus]|nr:Nucleolar complex protein 4 [Allomyces arbusculus]
MTKTAKPSSLPAKDAGALKKHSKEDITELVNEVRSLERAVLLSNANINNMVKIAKLAGDSYPHRVIYAAIHAQRRLFAHFHDKGAMTKAAATSTDAVAAQLAHWLRKQYQSFVARLLDLVDTDDVSLQVAVVKLLLDLTAVSSADLQKLDPATIFDNVFFIQIVHRIFMAREWSTVFTRDVLDLLLEKDDVRFYLFKNLTKLIQNELKDGSSAAPALRKRKRALHRDDAAETDNDPDRVDTTLGRFAQNAYFVLEKLDRMPANNDALTKFMLPRDLIPDKHLVLGAVKHKRAFTDFVISYLRLPLTPALYKKILMLMNARIIPNMTDPRLLMTFLTESYDQGGSTSLLALHAVFTLIAEHNLDYPDFYKKLYNLFDRNLFHVKYRSRFFRLFNLFMQSTHIPVYLVAAFIKKMCRLALYAPPAAVLITLPFVYNMLKQHPQCMVLIHRVDTVNVDNDPFDMNEEDPAKARALDSSLWEVVSLQSHYFPNIATVARIFQDKMTKPGYNLEDFLDYTYQNLFETVHVASLKKTPPLNYEISSTLVREGEPIDELFSF